MQYEIDYIPVGTGEKGGDAIALRYGDFSDPMKQNVVVIDGGTKDSGKLLVEHIKEHYSASHIDLIVASHLHMDHISGLTEVLENFTVGKLAVHCPWEHTQAIKKMTHTSSTLGRLETKLEKSLSGLSTLVDLAASKKVPIIQPFQGEKLLEGVFVLGPAKDYYQQLLANFGATPQVKEEHRIEKVISFAKETAAWIAEAMHIETLSDDHADTDAENNSSLILLAIFDNKKFLFTGDAGKGALTKAIEFADSIQPDLLLSVDFFDVPHHGSKRNLGPSILNKLMPKKAFICCPPKGDPKHPSRKVINALLRRDCKVHTNKSGFTLCHRSDNAPARSGWGAATPESFFDQVEE